MHTLTEYNLFFLSILPLVSAQSTTPTPTSPPASFEIDPDATAPPNRNFFTASPWINNATEDAVNQVSGWFYLLDWDTRGDQIRSGHGTRECLGNLSLALASVGNLNAAEYSGASGALSLLPTAGALIGSPAKELWIVFKLMPIAGVLSMLLSLGGTIAPSDAGAYDISKGLRFGGLMRSLQVQEKDAQEKINERQARSPQIARKKVPVTDVQTFAEKVLERAQDDSGNSYSKAWFGVALQVFFLGAILITMWFAQKGGVITWWCRVSSCISFREFALETLLSSTGVGLDVLLVFPRHHYLGFRELCVCTILVLVDHAGFESSYQH